MPVFFNLCLDKFIILDYMVFFETFCINDKSFFDCSLDRCHFCVYYLFNSFCICCNVYYRFNDYILDFARVFYLQNLPSFFLKFSFFSVCTMSSGVVNSSTKFIIFILSFKKASFFKCLSRSTTGF